MTSCQVRANITPYRYQYICHAFNNSRFNFEQKEATVLAFLISDEVVYHYVNEEYSQYNINACSTHIYIFRNIRLNNT